MLVFSIPFMVTTVEANVVAEAGKSAVKEAAKRDAEKDAKSVNELIWLAAGCLGSVSPFILGSACLVAEASGVSLEDQAIFGPCSHRERDFCCLSIIGAGVLLPTFYAVIHSPTPRAERFLGNHRITSILTQRLTEEQSKYSGLP